MQRILDFFCVGTEQTVTAAKVGMEIETQFLDSQGQPVKPQDTREILSRATLAPDFCELKLELGCHNFELNIKPHKNPYVLISKAKEALGWLYKIAESLGYYPVFEPAPLMHKAGELLFLADRRDELWVKLDGRLALEYLCRCSSVQFIIDVNPADAIGWINRLWQSRAHEYDYAKNDWLWRRYIAESLFGYQSDRYAGPSRFESFKDYAQKLAEHVVVMHKGRPCRQSIEQIKNLDINLFLRSVWWHYRLRRYGEMLALEIRPFSRRSDESFYYIWRYLANILRI